MPATDKLSRDSARIGDDSRIRAILGRVCELTGMGFAAVAQVTDGRWIACQVDDKIEFGLEPGDELDLKTTICDEIRDHGRAVFIDHVADHCEWRTHPTPMLYGFQSYASLPILLDDGEFFGTLCAIDPQPQEISSIRIVATLQSFAAELGQLLSRRLEVLHQGTATPAA